MKRFIVLILALVLCISSYYPFKSKVVVADNEEDLVRPKNIIVEDIV